MEKKLVERVQESGLGAFEFTVQLLSAVFKHRALRWIESDVLQLRRVSCEIVEFLDLIGNKVAHILVSALPQGEPPRHAAEIVRARAGGPVAAGGAAWWWVTA